MYNLSYSRCKEKITGVPILLLKYCNQTVKLKSAFEFIPFKVHKRWNVVGHAFVTNARCWLHWPYGNPWLIHQYCNFRVLTDIKIQSTNKWKKKLNHLHNKSSIMKDPIHFLVGIKMKGASTNWKFYISLLTCVL